MIQAIPKGTIGSVARLGSLTQRPLSRITSQTSWPAAAPSAHFARDD